MSAAAFGSFDDLLEITNEPLRPIAVSLRGTIMRLHPEVSEVVQPGERAATYGVGPKKMSEGYAYIIPYSGWVNLGFFRGASLPDPAGLLDGAGAAMRHVKIRKLEEVGQAELHSLLAAALAERRATLGR